MSYLFSHIQGYAKKNPEIYNWSGQKVVIDRIKKTIWTEIQKSFIQYGENFIGINTDITNFVFSSSFKLEIHVVEINKTYSISAYSLADYKKTHENSMLRNGIVIHILPLKIMDEVL